MTTAAPDRLKHPCFNEKAKGQCGRVHLPVAPKCNIQCKYCNRKYDCVNESRPGVTSGVLKPAEALEYMDKVLAKEPRITVVGIAGPGDPFANAEKTLETIRLIRAKYPHMLFCISSNGLGVPAHLDEIAALGITHMTITCNAVDPELAAKFYSWVRDGKVVYRDREAAELLLSRQLAAIKGLKERGITVKVNTIITPGLNDGHVETLAAKMAELGVDLLNLMPLNPTEGTLFEVYEEPDKTYLETLRRAAEKYVPQMRHCKRCRADAVGMLDDDKSIELAGCLSACKKKDHSLCGGMKDVPELRPVAASGPAPDLSAKPHVAVATMEGLLVNKHLGETEAFQIWTRAEDGGFTLLEERDAPEIGGGSTRWFDLAETLADCRAVLVARIGGTPQAILEERGIIGVETEGFIEDALKAVYETGDLRALRPKQKKACGMGCSGTGEGC